MNQNSHQNCVRADFKMIAPHFSICLFVQRIQVPVYLYGEMPQVLPILVAAPQPRQVSQLRIRWTFPSCCLSRYCAKVSCPASGETHQIDCFTSCSEHVTSTVDEVDWKSWGLALAANCQAEQDKLACADRQTWGKLTSSHGLNSSEPLSSTCREVICDNHLSCSRLCLNTALALPAQTRSISGFY